MSDTAVNQTIDEIAGNQEAYNDVNLMDLSLEQAIRLVQLHKMHKTHENMVLMGTELKERHRKVQELHKLLQLIQKNTNQEEGDNRGKLTLKHSKLASPNVELANDLTRALKAQSKQNFDSEGKKVMRLELNDSTRELLKIAQAQGLTLEIKNVYEGEEVQQLLDAVRGITGIESAEEWAKVSDIVELKKRLQEAKDVYHLDFKWPVEEFSREDREALTSALDTTCKDCNLQNDMQMHDLNRAYQERLEILQMARGIIKALHDDKVHKARSSGQR